MTQTAPETPATRYLEERGISYRLFQHAGPIQSLEQAAEERGQSPDQVVRSLLFRTETGQFFLVLMPGPGQVSWPKIRKTLGVRRLTTADAEEVVRITGYQPGTVTPFGLNTPLRILIDQRMLGLREISLGSGVRGLAILMDAREVLRALPEGEIGDFTAQDG